MTESSTFPAGGSRLIQFVIFDPRGEVDDHVLYALRGLRPYAVALHAVVNGALTEPARARLEPLVDDILVRDNAGFDIGAHKDGLAALGSRISDFDEIVLVNDTWFGPVYPFREVFDRMDAVTADFWGLTDHGPIAADPAERREAQARHLQSFWIAVRPRMFLSTDWATYWRDLPYFAEYWDAVSRHELVFTEVFENAGFSSAVAFPFAAYPVDNASIYAAELLLRDRCPVVKRRIFFHDPVFLARHAIIGRRVAEAIARTAYPMELMWANLARTVAPRILNTNAAMLEVIDPASNDDTPLHVPVVVHAHVRSEAGGKELVGALVAMPSFDLVLTAPAPESADAVAAHARECLPRMRSVQVYAESFADDVEAFLRVCQGMSSEDDVVVVHLHDGVEAGTTGAAQRYRYRRAMQSIVGSGTVIHRLVGLFEAEPTLGIVFAPATHIGVSPADRRWGEERGLVLEWRDRLGVRVPLDESAPLAPDESVWMARPSALRALTGLIADDRVHAAPPHVRRSALLRSLSSTAGEHGFHTRTALTRGQAGIGHTSLEYTLDLFASTTYGYLPDQLTFLDQADWRGERSARALVRSYLRLRHPRMGSWIAHRVHRTRSVVRRWRAAIPKRGEA